MKKLKLILALGLMMLSLGAQQAQARIVDLGTFTKEYNTYKVKDGDTLTGTLPVSAKILIDNENAYNGTITLRDVSINANGALTSGDYAGITCNTLATIVLQGKNIVKGFNNKYPGIQVTIKGSLTIKGDGYLEASANGKDTQFGGAGIGGGLGMDCHSITIEGGTITAKGLAGAAGIGGGMEAGCNGINITGGDILAVGGKYAPGIGIGMSGHGGDITITEDVTCIQAYKGDDAPWVIGYGTDGSKGHITIAGKEMRLDPESELLESPYIYAPGIIDLAEVTEDIVLTNGRVIFGTLTKNVKISIADGATITLNSATINGTNDEAYDWAGLTCEGDATIILRGSILGGSFITGFYHNNPGIYIGKNNTLTIKGDESRNYDVPLHVQSNRNESNMGGAGIGPKNDSGTEAGTGAIVIESGIIVAEGGYGSAGIGAANHGGCGDIVIKGGYVSATGGTKAAGIGGGFEGNCGNITITNDVKEVTAERGQDNTCCVGAGNNAICGTVTIGGKVYESGLTNVTFRFVGNAEKRLKELISDAEALAGFLEDVGETEAAAELNETLTAATAVVYKEDATADEIYEALDALQTACDKAAVVAPPYIAMFAKQQMIMGLKALLKEDDSDACKQIIADAEAAVESAELTYDNSKSIQENLADMMLGVLNPIYNQADADLEAQREKEQSGGDDDIAAAKQELEQWMFAIGLVYQLYDMTGDADGYAEMEALLVNADAIDSKEDATLAEINAQIATLKEAANAHKAEVILYHQLLVEEELDAMLEEGDSEECKQIIADAKEAYKAALVWNDEISYIENIDAFTEAYGPIYDQAVLDLAAQRAKEQSGGDDDIAAAKEELNQWMFVIGMVYQVYDMTGDADGYAEMEALLVDASVIDLKEDATLAEINAQIATLKEAAESHKAEVILYYQILGAEELNALLEEGDSEECKQIIADAIEALNTSLVWNDEISYIDNIDALAYIFDAVYEQAVLDLAAQRAGEHATAIETVESQKSNVESRKVFRNGILYIEHNGKRFNAQGTEVK